MCLFSNSEKLEIDYLNCWSCLLEVDFLNLCIYLQAQKHNWSKFLILIYFGLKSRSILEEDFLNQMFKLKYVWSRFPKLMYIYIFSKLRNILEVCFISANVKKYYWSINNIPFNFFSVFVLHLYFFQNVHWKAYYYWTLMVWSINKAYLKYS